jgi:hypothetical protein
MTTALVIAGVLGLIVAMEYLPRKCECGEVLSRYCTPCSELHWESELEKIRRFRKQDTGRDNPS